MGETQIIDPSNWESGPTRAHLARYYLARGYVNKDDVVVDAAAGCGYGTELLSDVAKFVYGMDRNAAAIKHALKAHQRENNVFIVADIEMAEIPECDVVVSIETLEHLEDPHAFAKQMMRVAKRLIIFSIPLGVTTDRDPTHRHDFNRNRAHALFQSPSWKFFHSYTQGKHFIGVVYRYENLSD